MKLVIVDFMIATCDEYVKTDQLAISNAILISCQTLNSFSGSYSHLRSEIKKVLAITLGSTLYLLKLRSYAQLLPNHITIMY